MHVMGTIFSTPNRRKFLFLGLDVAIISVSVVLAYLLRFEGAIPPERYWSIGVVAGVMVGTAVPILWLLRAYETNLRFVAFRDILRIAGAIWIATGITGILLFSFQHSVFLGAPRSIVLIQAPFVFLGIAGYRLSKRAQKVIHHDLHEDGTGAPTLIVGAGETGSQIAKSVQDDEDDHDFNVVGFLDDDTTIHGTRIEDVPVLGDLSDLEAQIHKQDTEVLIIAISNVHSDLLKELDKRARDAGVEAVRIVPPVTELIDNEVTLDTTREISLEDLLGRDPIHIEDEELFGLIEGADVLVTGAAGTIGSELARQVSRYRPNRLVLVDFDESRLHVTKRRLAHQFAELEIQACLVDIRDPDAIGAVFERESVDLVFHAAAYKHVPMLEEYPDAALETNVIGTQYVLEAAAAAECDRFVLISTDKAVNPSSVMGATKRIAEHLVLERANVDSDMTCTAVRFGNVLGSRGSVIPIFERQLEEGGPLTVTHPEVERYFMTASEAASLVLQASSMGTHGDLFLLDMGEPVRILDLAHQFITLHGYEPETEVPIEIIGLREGEKLSEELTSGTEAVSGTTHPKIDRVRTDHGERLGVNLDRLHDIAASRDPEHAAQVIDGLLDRMEASPIDH